MWRPVFLLLVVAVCCSLAAHPIEHIIVLMEENRSFDHMLGFTKRSRPEINGLTGTESNYYKPGDPTSQKVTVSDTAPDGGPWDPDHSIGGTTMKIFGTRHPKPSDKEKMDGFIAEEHSMHKDPDYIMRMWNETGLPVLNQLSKEFALFDEWFCSLPGPTFPNRLFAYSSTSHGLVDDDIVGYFPQRTIFEEFEKKNLTWSVYFQEVAAQWLLIQMRTPERLERFKLWEEFEKDVKGGTLANFVYLEPAYFPVIEEATDQHPDHSVSAGERLYKRVYETLRNSPYWEKSLFIITYDEHGGFYDHVPPPQGVPNPDGINHASFNFTRLGVRIPTVAISPYVESGKLVHGPPAAQKPQSNSAYDATSVFATIKKLWDMPEFLTKRDAWAGTFEHIFTKTPRTDCPTTLPDVPRDPTQLAKERARPPTGLQQDLVKFTQHLTGETPTGATQLELGQYVTEAVQRYLKRSK